MNPDTATCSARATDPQHARFRCPTFLAFSLLLSCSNPAPAPAPAPDETKAVASAPTAALSVNCPSTLIAHYNHLVQNGCEIQAVTNGMGLFPRLLRNVPFATRGHRFKDPALHTFFTTEKMGCDAPWYTPGTDPITLNATETACVDKLKAYEDGLRAALPIPAKVEAFVLNKVANGGLLREDVAERIVLEIGRHVGKPWYGSQVMVQPTEEGGWSINMYKEEPWEGVEPPMNQESSVVIRCDATSECETLFAG